MSPNPPTLDPNSFAWVRSDSLKTPIPIGNPPYTKAAPDEILKTTKCSCFLERLCSCAKSTCSLAK